MYLNFEEFELENRADLKPYNHEEREEIYLIAVERNMDIKMRYLCLIIVKKNINGNRGLDFTARSETKLWNFYDNFQFLILIFDQLNLSSDERYSFISIRQKM
jgi:hypothetical protein